ncbi:MAG: sugar ABC transporter ATP-binding protein [Chloroflexi bacterium]|nr:MAG: sugar ABC transporter ATP-binding protein [Chloroflexota bacterium]
MNKVSLSAQNIVKHYGGVVALSDGNLDVESGEVVAFLGANGSGKSTLSKIITGVVAPDAGRLVLDGKEVRFPSPQAAQKEGIAAVYQELSLIPDMTVAENIWLAHEPLQGGLRVNRQEIARRTEDLLALFAGTFSDALQPDTPVGVLPPDERQIVEILKAFSHNPRLMILDEATASLDARQVSRLFELIARWKAQGMAIVFVSHRMDEIMRVADRATVLRNGKTVGVRRIAETTEQELVELMIEGGEAVPHRRAEDRDLSAAPVRLQARDLRTRVLRGVSLEVRDGELLGIGGLQGQGQSDLLLALFGAIPFSGSVTLSGEAVHFTHPRQAMEKDVAFVPGDRATEGLLLRRSILDNLLLPSWRKYGFPLRMQAARRDAGQIAAELRLVMESLDAAVSSLSGGNAQKVVIGKWLLRRPKVLLLNDPTKGVDVGAKVEFYNLLADLRRAGTAILFYSSDDEELLGLCDRVLVLHDGVITAELAGESLTHANLVAASMGTVQENNV